jgi:hypothetical protein
LGLFGGSGDIFVSSGNITASSVGDLARSTRFNNAVFVEGPNAIASNLVGGIFTATSSEGNCVRVGPGGAGAIVTNHGTINSLRAAGVEVDSVPPGQTFRLINTGLITGPSAAFSGGTSAADIAITNSGHMIADVILGTGDDVFAGRGGRIAWFLVRGPWQ